MESLGGPLFSNLKWNTKMVHKNGIENGDFGRSRKVKIISLSQIRTFKKDERSTVKISCYYIGPSLDEQQLI